MEDLIVEEYVWVIMTKDRKLIAKGIPRNRYLCGINETSKRILTYSSKKLAENGFKLSGFCLTKQSRDWEKENGFCHSKYEEYLEAVKIKVQIIEFKGE